MSGEKKENSHAPSAHTKHFFAFRAQDEFELPLYLTFFSPSSSLADNLFSYLRSTLNLIDRPL